MTIESRPRLEHRPTDAPEGYLREVMLQSIERYRKAAERRQLTAEERRSLEVCQDRLSGGKSRTAGYDDAYDDEFYHQQPSGQPSRLAKRQEYLKRADDMRRRIYEAHKSQMAREACR